MTDQDQTEKVTIEHKSDEDAQPEKEIETITLSTATYAPTVTLTDSAEVTIEHQPTKEPETEA